MLKKMIAVALVLSVFLGAWQVGMAAPDPVSKFQKNLDKLVKRCEKSLVKADSVNEMDVIAASCDAGVKALLVQLEQDLGHPVEFESFFICVTNLDLNYTACFDPIIISGGS